MLGLSTLKLFDARIFEFTIAAGFAIRCFFIFVGKVEGKTWYELPREICEKLSIEFLLSLDIKFISYYKNQISFNNYQSSLFKGCTWFSLSCTFFYFFHSAFCSYTLLSAWLSPCALEKWVKTRLVFLALACDEFFYSTFDLILSKSLLID